MSRAAHLTDLRLVSRSSAGTSYDLVDGASCSNLVQETNLVSGVKIICAANERFTDVVIVTYNANEHSVNQ
jgi:hypothetical protein